MPAYVYLIEEVPIEGESTGPWTKIGYSQNPPEWRMDANLKRGNPRDIRVAEAFEYATEEEAYAAESAAHAHFAAKARTKEWFQLPWQEIAIWFDSQGARRRSRT